LATKCPPDITGPVVSFLASAILTSLLSSEILPSRAAVCSRGDPSTA
jgi:hypothetical protein